jgi:hypothetical protein
VHSGCPWPAQEELNLMIFRDDGVTSGQGHEPCANVVDGAFMPEKSELADRAVGEWRPKPDLNELDEMSPGWRPAGGTTSVHRRVSRMTHTAPCSRACHACKSTSRSGSTRAWGRRRRQTLKIQYFAPSGGRRRRCLYPCHGALGGLVGGHCRHSVLLPVPWTEPDEGHAESLFLLLDIAYVVGDSFPEPESVDGDMVVDLDLLIPDCHRLGNR